MPTMENLLTIKNHMPGYRHHWIYYDHGMPVMVVARYEQAGNKTYRQFHLENNEWIEGMPPSPYPFFGLNTLKNISPFKSLLITEGEKCASVIHQLGWPAISTVLGSQNPASSDWTPARYYSQFIILRDNDKPGISFAQKAAVEISRIRKDAEILVANLSPEIVGGDLIDWLQKTVLRGQVWNGFDPIPTVMLDAVRQALYEEIKAIAIGAKECPYVSFRPIEAMFDIAPRPFQI